MQAASTVFLVRPARFSFNAETAPSNSFQQNLAALTPDAVQAQAFAEFDAAVAMLRAKGVHVLVFEDTPAPPKPDAVFPNNWLTLHPDGRVLLYPMCAPNRRHERRADILEELGRQFRITEVVDLSPHEQEGRFLEGTGSILFDHVHRVAYACLSPRTHAALFAEVAATLGYRSVAFHANDQQGHAIYHTNVMMCIGARFAVVCLASITDAQERATVAASLVGTGHELVDITPEQVAHFAGNMLTLRVATTELLVLSQQAFEALTAAQRQTLGRYGELVPLAIPTIETIGGGSARCMLAEVFLPRL
ncbi:citrulline utilization hydrolase CtlX [Hymenobacter crusticola]|uniref:Amidinotransferase n=1 Tax=Hymenobacter crusticola TaxID=1770526 RepID=A0A243W7Q8_9BACT|nr:arginine deiminase-related protein [Hymenobacter crusticola]OUJ70856.1 amidinotransferase [Hymenobacter crusticola]